MAVPSAGQYQPYITEASSGTGLPIGVVQAQAYDESGYNPHATSSAGAEGFWQFLPSTYNAVAAQAGVSPGTEYNVADETKAYVVYMNQLLKEEGGSIQKALEAYNAGPGNLPAGAGYAQHILSEAGTSSSATTSTPAQAQTAAADIHIPGFGGITSLLDPATWLKDIGNSILGIFGLGSGKDLFQRFAIILLGAALLIVGIRILSSGTSSKQNVVGQLPDREEKSPVSKTADVSSGEAVEAAAVA